jgi:hypothetical protein
MGNVIVPEILHIHNYIIIAKSYCTQGNCKGDVPYEFAASALLPAGATRWCIVHDPLSSRKVPFKPLGDGFVLAA